MAIAACGGEDPTPTPAPTAVPEQPAEAAQAEEPAPEPVYGEAMVDSVVVEKQGEKYVANTIIMLPDSCTQVDETTQEVDGNNINITVTTVRPGDLVCAQSIIEFEMPIPVDTSGLADGEYAVSVNGVIADDPVVVGGTASTGEDGIVWEWVDVVNRGTNETTTVPNPENYTISFNEDGTFSGMADCNAISGEYSTENGLHLTLGPSTMMFCGEESLDQLYLDLLSRVVTGGPNGDAFAMETAGGGERMNFRNGGEASAASAEVTGEIVYKQKIALPDDAVVCVQIQNISLADAPAQVIGEQTYVTEGQQVPLPFAVPYDPADIEENMMYGLSIRIEAADGTLLFINDTSIPVITNGNPTSGIVAEVIMVNAPAGGEEASMAGDDNVITIDPSMVSIDTQDLPISYQTIYVAEKPYDASQPPGPMGLPAHIEILFGTSERTPGDTTTPVMYIIPVEAYEKMWEEAGSDSVTNTMNEIAKQTYFLPQPPPTSGMPALPYEEVVGFNDLAVQVDRAVTIDAQTDEMATKNGYRFVGRWGQSPNPVTNTFLRYVYQGFTNDGAYLVSFFYPVRSDSIADEPSSEEMDAFTNDMEAYMTAQAEALNGLSASDWQPDLETLDAVVQSLKITETPANGLVNKTYQWTGEIVNPSTGDVTSNELGESEYSLTFNSDGTFSGVVDCNNIAGSYTVDGGIIGGVAFQPGPSTAAFCGEESKDVAIQNLLAATQSYRVATGGNKMNLIMPAGGGEYVFDAVPPQPAIVVESPQPIERVVGRQLQWITFFDTVEGELTIGNPELYQMMLNEDGTVNVLADCKQTEGTYTVDGSNIVIELGPVTMQICSEESLADQYLGYLTAVRIFFNQDGDVFFDLMADGGTMQFADAASSDSGSADAGLPEELLNTTWQWVGFSDPATGPLEIPNPENYLLDLQVDGSFLVKADCNNGSGVYTVDGSSISFVLGPFTRAYCGDDSLDTQYLQYLEAAAIWFTESGDLYFDLKYDSGTMQFSPATVSLGEEAETPNSESSAASEEVPADAFQIDLQGLADFYTWEVVPGYPPSPGPGGIGSSAHVAILFNGATLTETQMNNGPVIYIYPTEAYINVAGQSVGAQVEQLVTLLELADGVTPEPDTWMPLLPPPGSLMDRWVQYLKLDFTQGQGVRYVSDSPYRQQMGVWANNTTGYYYQALTEDGSFYISLFWPVSTDSLPNTADEADEGAKAEATNPETNAAYQEAIRTTLNDLSASDWDPSLDDLDALAASIQFQP